MQSARGTVDLAFVLRGRPGLGHIMPGFALAAEAVAAGRRVAILTYSNGYEYLARSQLPSSIDLYRLECEGPYRDWPGLDIYDHGLREIFPLIDRLKPQLCCFGGEYVLAPLSSVLPCKTAMLFNPDIFEQQAKNTVPSTLFLRLFSGLNYLVPLVPLSDTRVYMEEFFAYRDKFTSPGPFVYIPPPITSKEPENAPMRVVIANGGGVTFPRSTASYSSVEASPAKWLEQTVTMTRASIEQVLARAPAAVCVDVFSCLSGADNARLASTFARDTRVTIRPVSLQFYGYLRAADLVISRAGAGFISDVATTAAAAIVWPLQGHDEQLINARTFSARRPRTRVVVNEREFADAIDDLLGPAMHDRWRSGAPAESLPAYAQVSRRLLSELLN